LIGCTDIGDNSRYKNTTQRGAPADRERPELPVEIVGSVPPIGLWPLADLHLRGLDEHGRRSTAGRGFRAAHRPACGFGHGAGFDTPSARLAPDKPDGRHGWDGRDDGATDEAVLPRADGHAGVDARGTAVHRTGGATASLDGYSGGYHRGDRTSPRAGGEGSRRHAEGGGRATRQNPSPGHYWRPATITANVQAVTAITISPAVQCDTATRLSRDVPWFHIV